MGWYRHDHDRIDLIPDKPLYHVGETAKLLVKNPYKDVDALITYERFGILKHYQKKLNGGSQIIEIPIDQKDYAPGFYVSVHLIQGRVSEKIENNVDLGKPSFKMGLARIEVVNPETQLALSVQTDQKDYNPNSLVKAKINIDQKGSTQKVELAIAVVDDKVLSLVGNYKRKFDIHRQFYSLPGLNVATSQMLTALIGRRHYGKKGAADGGDGASKNAIEAREAMLPQAYWNPSLITDQQGNASFEFEVPDNLTTWRILVVGVDKNHRFGFGEGTFTTSKKIMIEPALPNFVREGDRFDAKFTLFNRMGKDQDIQAKAVFEKSVNLESTSWLKKNILDQANALLGWQVQVPFEEKIFPIDIHAKGGGHDDRLKLSLPIKFASSFDVVAQHGSSLEEMSEVALKLPEGIYTDRGGLEVEVSPSMIGQMNDSISYMIGYPYQCWEQRLSKLMMLATAITLKDYIDIEQLQEIPALPSKFIRELLASMEKFQAPNGGMGYWKSDLRTVSPYLSIYTAMVLGWLEEMSVDVPTQALKKVRTYVEALAAGKINFPSLYDDVSKTRMLAFAAYEMSLRNKVKESQVNALFAKRKSLHLMGLSFLMSAAKLGAQASEIIDTLRNEILARSNITSGKVQFEDAPNAYMPRFLGSPMRTNCRMLTALLETGKATDLIEPLAKHILNGRDQNRWNNTQENVYCFKAMVDYARQFEKTMPDYQTKVSVGSVTTGQARFKGFKQKAQTIELPMAKLKAPKIQIQKDGQGRLYYTTRLKYALKNPSKKGKHKGFQVQRHYEVKQGQKWVEVQDEINIKRGDLVRVTLKVTTPATRYQVALIDQLPAGLEPLNAALATTSKKALEGLNEASSIFTAKAAPDAWWQYYWGGGFYHQEVRLSGPQYFADFLRPGSQVLTFMAQAIATGTFTAPPARAEEMYDPEVYGTSTPATFVISE